MLKRDLHKLIVSRHSLLLSDHPGRAESQRNVAVLIGSNVKPFFERCVHRFVAIAGDGLLVEQLRGGLSLIRAYVERG